MEYTCIECGLKYQEEVMALGHKMGEWEITKYAHYDDEKNIVPGEKKRCCSMCDHVEYDETYEFDPEDPDKPDDPIDPDDPVDPVDPDKPITPDKPDVTPSGQDKDNTPKPAAKLKNTMIVKAKTVNVKKAKVKKKNVSVKVSKAITVKKEQLPIIRAHQLKISLSEVERNKYSVNFEQNGGTGATNLQNLYCIPGDVVSVKSGYVFDNWYLDQELINVAVPGTPLVANTTLFAKWLEARLVSFSVDGEVINTQTVGDGRTAYYFEPTKEGYEFKGWFTDDVTFENQFDFNTPITANITLCAKFEEITE
jgi:uncharacterized repeat protein (TIGR02543 family)